MLLYFVWERKIRNGRKYSNTYTCGHCFFFWLSPKMIQCGSGKLSFSIGTANWYIIWLCVYLCFYNKRFGRPSRWGEGVRKKLSGLPKTWNTSRRSQVRVKKEWFCTGASNVRVCATGTTRWRPGARGVAMPVRVVTLRDRYSGPWLGVLIAYATAGIVVIWRPWGGLDCNRISHAMATIGAAAVGRLEWRRW